MSVDLRINQSGINRGSRLDKDMMNSKIRYYERTGCPSILSITVFALKIIVNTKVFV